jgi:hypothetical protein
MEKGEVDEMATSLRTLAEIISLCRERPDLSQIAQARLNEIAAKHSEPTASTLAQPPFRYKADIAIAECNSRRRKEGRDWLTIRAVQRRQIRTLLGKKLGIGFEGDKPPKKRDDVMKWFDDHWTEVQDPFLRILESNDLCSFK